IGALMALHEARVSGLGQVVDVALSESVFSLLESILPEYGYDGRVRERSGNVLGGAAPSNTYRTADNRWLAIGANGDGIFRRFAAAIGKPELATDPRFVNNQARREHVHELDQIIGEWVAARSLAEANAILDAADVPAGPVYSIADIAADPQYQAREMLLDRPDDRVGRLLMPGIVPKLSRTPGAVRWNGPSNGADTAHVLRERLGVSLPPPSDA
ncbi:MAG: CoA transferase, partial [Dehalococcoidia bacterium]|nr:CoA transferase [Dehalococcoidia bacterium]